MKLRTPSYRLHRPSDRAVVTLGGRDFYLGPYDSPESHTEFNRLVGEWLVRGRPRVERSANDRTINELLLAYIHFAEGYYRKPDGRQTSEVDCIELAMRPLRDMYGHTLAGDFGPRAQEVLKPWLRPELQAYLFNPREAIAARNCEWREARQSKVQPSQRNRGKAKPKWAPSEVYSVASYGKAIRRGCEEAGVPHWHPHQLRHNAATWLRKEFGLDIARVILGHRSSDVTEIYAELDFSRAVEVVGKIG